MTYKTYENICRDCGNMYTSSISSIAGRCSICHNANYSRNSIAVSSDTDGDKSFSFIETYITVTVFSVIMWFVGLSTKISLIEDIGAWCIRLCLLPLYLIGLAVTILNGIVTGDYSAMTDLTHMYWVSVKK